MIEGFKISMGDYCKWLNFFRKTLLSKFFFLGAQTHLAHTKRLVFSHLYKFTLGFLRPPDIHICVGFLNGIEEISVI